MTGMLGLPSLICCPKTFIARIVREQWKNKSGRRLFILEGRKAGDHGHSGPGGRQLSQESCTFLLFVPAQQGNECMAFCQSANPCAHLDRIHQG